MAKDGKEVLVAEVQKETKKELRTREKKKCISGDKENIPVLNEKRFVGGTVVSKSPLPADYPRIPLQDITAVLSPANVQKIEEGESSTRKARLTRAKTRKSSFSCSVQFELNVVEETKVSTKGILGGKQENVLQVAEVKDNGATRSVVSSKPENKGPITFSTPSEPEDCPSAQQQAKRRRPQPRASAGAERSTSMLKFR